MSTISKANLSHRVTPLQQRSHKKKMSKLALVLTTLTLQLLQLGEAGTIHNKKAQIATACGASDYLRGLEIKAGNAVRNALSKAIEAATTAMKIKVAIASTSPENQAAGRIIVARIDEGAVRAMATILAQNHAVTAGLSAIGRLAGGQEVIAELNSLKIADVATVAAASATRDSTHLKITPQLQISKKPACIDTDNNRKKDKEKDAADTTAPDAISLEVLTPATPGAYNGVLTICGHGAAGTAITGITCADDQTSFGIKGGSVFKITIKTTTKKEAKLASEYTEETSTNTVPNGPTITAELKLLLELEKAVAAVTTITIDTEPSSVAEQREIRDAIARVVGGDSATYANPATKPKVDALIKAMFGDKAENVKSTIEKDIKDLKPPKAAVGGTGDKKLETINDPKELADAQIYYAIKNIVAYQDGQKNIQANPSCPTKTEKAEEPKKTADECKKHTTAEDCKKETGCEFDEKKPEGERCFQKAETEKKDEKSFSSNLRVSVPQVFAALVLEIF
uniref:Variant surface glycoprotein (VSG), putative n=1 Tax=Trypanosoma brucei brucei (strain 927/4 GUTat10.1) TaxID=185431 RepID=Q4FKL6_TRYB2|nr:variant surface glycoprotein (VSG), putative [Trypanosoma brucei brucei TREU927]